MTEAKDNKYFGASKYWNDDERCETLTLVTPPPGPSASLM